MDEEECKIAVLDSPFEAQLIEDLLKEREIPFRIRSYYDEVYGSLFQMNKGWGAIYAPAEAKEEILGVLREIRQSAPDFDEWEQFPSN